MLGMREDGPRSSAPGAPGGWSRPPSPDIGRELVWAAEAVLIRDGPGGVTVRAVAAQAGIAPMGVYNRLGGKDGLVDALLIRGFDRLRAALAGGAQADLPEPPPDHPPPYPTFTPPTPTHSPT